MVIKGSGTANIPHKYEKNACPNSCNIIHAASKIILIKKLSQTSKAIHIKIGKKALIPKFLYILFLINAAISLKARISSIIMIYYNNYSKTAFLKYN